MSQTRALQRLSALSAQILGSRRAANVGLTKTRRHASSEAGDNNTGHINTTPKQDVLFFNSLLPVNLFWFAGIPWTLQKILPRLAGGKTSLSAVDPATVVQDAAAAENLTDVKVIEVLPRLKEGGAFLKFEHDQSVSSQAVADAVGRYLADKDPRPWWNPLADVKARLVLGKPWVEDLSRLPSERLKVEFLPSQPDATAAELSQEQLYSFFRPYGKLVDIVAQASDSNVKPRFAYLDFRSARIAVMAKNCLHGYTVSEKEGGGKLGTVFRLTYEKKRRFGWIRDWLFSHPRIVIPIVAALVAGITVAVFDPIRTLSIKWHITRVLHVEDNAVFRWFKTQGEDLINRVKQLQRGGDAASRGMAVVWDDRKDQIEQIRAWLMEDSDSFIIVQGPKGSGKKELVVDHALERKREAHKVLVIDCKPIQEARGDSPTITAAANQVGYSPVFSWMNSISGLIDLAAQGTTGVKTGFSETLENQFVKILNQTASALKSIALESRDKHDKDADLGSDEWLEAHPERRPVVVVDNFLHKSSEPGADLVYDKIAEWAARLTTSNISHVIFLTHDVSFTKSLSKALPDRVFRQISLQDCSPEVAKRYVINHLDFDDVDEKDKAAVKPDAAAEETVRLTPSQRRKDLVELDDVIDQLGGRLTDLENLARRVKAGETPNRAVKEMVDQAASELIKMYILSGDEKRSWGPHQAWALVRALASSDSLRYNEVLLTDAFASGGGDAALAALEQAELISIQSAGGRPSSIRPGRPIYHAAFQRLVADRVLRAKMDLALLGEAIGGQAKGIDRWEQELQLLGGLPGSPAEIRRRVQYLLGKIAGSQDKIESYEREQGELKKVLQTEF